MVGKSIDENYGNTNSHSYNSQFPDKATGFLLQARLLWYQRLENMANFAHLRASTYGPYPRNSLSLDDQRS
jgi:hypothetical protein